jgi:NAD(P)-dependent dehydrogenase (short-subunit alcohol dehydrogenase family)
MHTSLIGKVALVTGASRGIGKGIALELARAGCDVAVNYFDDEPGALGAVDEIKAMGRKAIAFAADVSDSGQVSRMFQKVSDAFGQLDILVNNAGIQTWKPLLELSEEDWDRVLATNLKGSFLCTKQAGALMVKSGGAIINIGSGCNKLAFRNLVDYTASKGGLEMFTKVAAVELGQYKIRVNCVAPGAIEI